MCILHALMCIGRIVANEVRSVCVGQDPAVIVEVAKILQDYKTGISRKGKAEPDGEESWRLLVARNQLSQVPCIDSSMDAAAKAMSRTLTALYQTWHDPLALQIGEVARAFRSALCPTSKSPYLVFLFMTASVWCRILSPMAWVCFAVIFWNQPILSSKTCTTTIVTGLGVVVQ